MAYQLVDIVVFLILAQTYWVQGSHCRRLVASYAHSYCSSYVVEILVLQEVVLAQVKRLMDLFRRTVGSVAVDSCHLSNRRGREKDKMMVFEDRLNGHLMPCWTVLSVSTAVSAHVEYNLFELSCSRPMITPTVVWIDDGEPDVDVVAMKSLFKLIISNKLQTKAPYSLNFQGKQPQTMSPFNNFGTACDSARHSAIL